MVIDSFGHAVPRDEQIRRVPLKKPPHLMHFLSVHINFLQESEVRLYECTLPVYVTKLVQLFCDFFVSKHFSCTNIVSELAENHKIRMT